MNANTNNQIQNRNRVIDCVKGCLIVLVVIRHVLQYSVKDEGAFIGNLIWAIQMPGFMIISGFFSARNISHPKEFVNRIIKSSKRYLIPFVSWFILADILVLSKYQRNLFKGLRSLFTYPESGLWFLWVVFVLSIMITVCNYFFSEQKAFRRYVFSLLIYFLSMAGLAVIAISYGNLSFLGIKLILYYSIFYMAGWLMGKKHSLSISNKAKEIILFVCILLFTCIISNYDLHNSEDNVLMISLRIICGFSGNYILYTLISNGEILFCKLQLDYIGKYTLEIYAVHMYFCSLMREDSNYSLFTTQGICNFLFSLIITSILSIIVIVVLKSNHYTNFLLFGCEDEKLTVK